MGSLLIVETSADPAPALEVFERQDLTAPAIHSVGGFDIYLYPPLGGGAPITVASQTGGFAAAAGVLLYRGRGGQAALADLLADWRGGGIDEGALMGGFAAVVQAGGDTALFTDRMGNQQLYAAPSARAWSTSFLALARLCGRRHLNTQAAYEYVFQGTTYGQDTLLDEVVQLAPDTCHPLTPGRTAVPRPLRLPDRPSARPFEDLRHQVSATLDAVFDALTAEGAPPVDTALSGGYDSRLILALLRARGVTPELHVYGAASDPDVIVAKAVAAAEGLAIKHIDKAAIDRPDPDALPEIVARNFHVFDGYPTDGIVDWGIDLATRLERCREGRVALNGGGGEIFRNFFYLPDRPLTSRQLLWTFYTQFDPRVAAAPFSTRRYHDRLGEKLKASLGAAAEPLSRTQVELAYPLFRCRFWTSRNTSNNLRLGPAMMPFLQPDVVAAAAGVPLRFKTHGAFEAALIAAADPALAAHPSAYGFAPVERPPWRKRLATGLTLARPTTLRRFSYRVQHRMRGPIGDPLLADGAIARVLSHGWDTVRPLFRPEACRDGAQLKRMATLAYLMETLDVSAGGSRVD